MSAAPLLEFRQVDCLRGGRMLFRRLDLSLRPGETLVLTGPNGIGKSSLIRVAAGLLRPFAGSVDRTVKAALADEFFALDDRLPLRRALAFWARLDRGDCDEALSATGLAHLAEVPVRMLSTGQRKRATLARVIASGAPLWLLDEPTNGLDDDGKALLTAVIERHCSAGGSVLAASHVAIGVSDPATLRLMDYAQ